MVTLSQMSNPENVARVSTSKEKIIRFRMTSEKCDFSDKGLSEITKSFRKCNKALTNKNLYSFKTTKLFIKSIKSIVLIPLVFFFFSKVWYYKASLKWIVLY